MMAAPIVYGDAVVTAAERAAPDKIVAPAADRNKDAILAQLRKHLSASSGVLEVASGSGQHAAYFVENLQGLVKCWQPTDRTEASLKSIHAYRAELPAHLQPLLQDARELDVRSWPALLSGGEWDAVLAVNLIHIAPPDVTDALLRGAAGALCDGGKLMLYGPFLVDGKPTTESNAAFDAKLRGMDPSYGIRDVGEVADKAARLGFRLVAREDMPANNFFVVFEKTDSAASGASSRSGLAAAAPA